MPRPRGGVCNTPGCPNMRPCPTPGHTKQAWAGSNRRDTLPTNWQTIRRAIIKRDGGCVNPLCTTPHAPLEVNHTGPADDHRPHLLETLCRTCHMQVTQRQASEGRAASRRAQGLQG